MQWGACPSLLICIVIMLLSTRNIEKVSIHHPLLKLLFCMPSSSIFEDHSKSEGKEACILASTPVPAVVLHPDENGDQSIVSNSHITIYYMIQENIYATVVVGSIVEVTGNTSLFITLLRETVFRISGRLASTDSKSIEEVIDKIAKKKFISMCPQLIKSNNCS